MLNSDLDWKKNANQTVDVLIIGSGAAGLMCAAQAGYRNRKVTVLDMGKKPARKILISGGGRCNFTNTNTSYNNYLSNNPHFIKSCLSRYTQHDFIDLVERHALAYHHKTLGQLFCDNSAQDLANILLTECEWAGVKIQLRTEVLAVEKVENQYKVTTNNGVWLCDSLVVASGGLTMPKLGATPIGYKIAEQFGLHVYPTQAALVPLTLHQHDKQRFEALAGVSIPCVVSNARNVQFKENILFTHRGLSGPAILQISSYWQAGEAVYINLLPEINLAQWLTEKREEQGNKSLKNTLYQLLPKRFIDMLYEAKQLPECQVKQLSESQITHLTDYLQNWQIKPNGTEGYRTAEVTLGGVDTNELSSKTFEAKKSAGLYFIGEVTDVTGWLGGYNFQYAWSCGWCCGQYV